ncbi:MAG: zinc ribbon domain-containing protein [Chloroflexota bacterium]
MSNQLVCSTCGAGNVVGDAFCGECGGPLPSEQDAADASSSGPDETAAVPNVSDPTMVPCWNCKTLNATGRTFCQRCGQELKDAAVADVSSTTTGSVTRSAPGTAAAPPTQAQRKRSPLILAGSIAAIAFLALAGVFLAVTLSGQLGDDAPLSGQASGTPTAEATSPATTEPTVAPTAEPTRVPPLPATPRATPEPTPRPTRRPTPVSGSRRAAEADLLARAFFLECTRWRQEDQPFAFGAQAAIRCVNPGSGVGQLAMFTFPTQGELNAYWIEKMDSIGLPLTETSLACVDSAASAPVWGPGDLACYSRGGEAQIRWTDDRTGMYALLDATDGDIDALYRWWRSKGRRLGRPLDETPGRPDTGPRLTIPPTVGDPGSPTAISCDPSEDIEDAWGRTWRVTQVSFFNRNGYERVILHLERTGFASGSATTSVGVRRIANADLPFELPAAPAPGSGRWTIDVDLSTGIRDATGLRAYAPSGMSAVKELSMLRGSSPHEALVSVSGSGCYQVRVPVFEPSASGDEQKGEIYLDIEG